MSASRSDAVVVLTVGQLRAAIADAPDEAHVRVPYAVDDDTADEQVAVRAQLDPTLWYPDARAYEPPRSPAEAWFTIETEFPPDDYQRGAR